MKAKAIFMAVLLCITALSGFACGGDGEKEGVKEVKFGCGFPLSGVYGAALGLPAKQGIELASEYIGEFAVAGEKCKWKLIFEDNGWTSAGGVATATKLIFDNGVNFMSQIGGDPALAAQTICEESGVILFTSAIPLDAFGPDKPHSFLGQTSVYPNSAALFKYITEAHPEVKTASMINEDTSSGRELVYAARSAAEYYGIEWLEEELIPVGTVEYYPVATKMASKNPDICYLGNPMVAPMRELGWEGIPFYMMWLSAFVDSMGMENAEGYLIYYPACFGEALPESLRLMAADYEDRFGAEFGQMAYHYAMLLYWVTDALKKAGTVDDVDQIIAALETETLDTPMGPVKYGLPEMDGIGHIVIMPCTIGEIRGGEYHSAFEMSADEAEALTAEIFGK